MTEHVKTVCGANRKYCNHLRIGMDGYMCYKDAPKIVYLGQTVKTEDISNCERK